MIDLQNTKVESLIRPTKATVNTNATSYGYLDTLGWDYAKIVIHASATHAITSAAFTTIALSEGTNSAAATGVVALTGGAATSASVGFVIATGTDTSQGAMFCLNVDLRKRERYLKLGLTPAAKGDFSACAVLTRGHQVPGADAGSVLNNVIG